MPYEESYKKEHVPAAKQFLFPIPEMKAWDARETAGKSEQDFGADCIKTGMLGSAEAVEAVVQCCERAAPGVPLVVDPTLAAPGLPRPLAEATTSALKLRLLPRAAL